MPEIYQTIGFQTKLFLRTFLAKQPTHWSDLSYLDNPMYGSEAIVINPTLFNQKLLEFQKMAVQENKEFLFPVGDEVVLINHKNKFSSENHVMLDTYNQKYIKVTPSKKASFYCSISNDEAFCSAELSIATLRKKISVEPLKNQTKGFSEEVGYKSIEQVLKNIYAIKNNNDLAYEIDRIFLMGSFLKGKERCHDFDIGVELKRKDMYSRETTWNAFLDTHDTTTESETKQYLKQGAKGVAILPGNMKRVEQDPEMTIYKDGLVADDNFIQFMLNKIKKHRAYWISPSNKEVAEKVNHDVLASKATLTQEFLERKNKYVYILYSDLVNQKKLKI